MPPIPRATCLVLLLGCLAGQGEERPLVRWEGRTMGSPYVVQVAGAWPRGSERETLRAEVEDCLREVNRQMSHYQPDSELSQFNRAPAHVPFRVSPAFARVARFSLGVARRSQGAFDPTLGPVINLWGFGEETRPQAVPGEAELQAALARTGYRHLSVTADNELIKDIPELQLNLSAVAKGFGVDEVVAILQRHGLSNLYVAIAGDVRVLGHNARGTNWQVGIAAPIERWRESDPLAAVAALSNQAISTSGDYQKFFRDPQGRRLSHVFDPRTGRPVQHNVAGVSVVAKDSMTADALGTTLFVLGPEAGLTFIEAWPEAGALFILREPDGQFRQVASRRFAALAGGPP